MKRPHGFAILTAIFILVVLAVLGAFIVGISSSQQLGSALDLQGARAYQAARTGVEWGAYRQLQNAACVAGPVNFVPAAATLAGFTVSVTCAATADANGGPTVYTVTATACNQPDAGGACPNTVTATGMYVERRQSATF